MGEIKYINIFWTEHEVSKQKEDFPDFETVLISNFLTVLT
jgi:hypothetical protein